MAKSLKDILVPVLFLVAGVFWVGIVATGGGPLLLLAALASLLSGGLLLAMPSNWVTRPLAGASALFGLVLTLYQAYEASTLLGTNLSNLGVYSLVLFVVFALVYAFLELQILSVGKEDEDEKKKP